MIPKLSKLTVDSMANLKQIWPCDITSGEEDNVSLLREIEVKNCKRLVNLFPCNPMLLLSNLEELKVKACSIEVLFNIDLGKTEQLKNKRTSLKNIELEALGELKEVWRINDENNSSGLIIHGIQAVESINIKGCKKLRNIFSPATFSFDMGAHTNIFIENSGINDAELINNWQRQEIGGISKQDIPTDDGNMSIVAFPSNHLTHTFSQLHDIHFDGFQQLKVVFELECSSINRELITAQQQPLLPCLEDLQLKCMDMLSHVWKRNNWKEFFVLHKHQPQSSFQNLTTIHLFKCKRIKYLFSPLMSRLLSSLKKVVIVECEGMEEVVLNTDEDEVLAASTLTTTLFPHLEYLSLSQLFNLKHIGGCVVKGTTNVIQDQSKFSQVGMGSWSLCQYSGDIFIRDCALSSLIPSYAARKMQKLQVLIIFGCRSMVEVFETKDISNNKNDFSGNVDKVSDATLPFPRPKSITMHHELPNLKTVQISACDILECIFTFSIFESLKKLESLMIGKCRALKVIVREEHDETSSKGATVVFPRLKSIDLQYLPNLEGFFLGKNIDFEWPLLDYVKITGCPKLKVFVSGESTTPMLNYIYTSLGLHYLQHGLNFHQNLSPSSDSSSFWPADAEGTSSSFHNLISISLKSNQKVKTIVPSNRLLQLKNLENIDVQDCADVTEVFEVASEVTNSESQNLVKIPKLREVNLEHLNKLKYIWNNNNQRKLEFPNLTRVSIYRCRCLEYVFTPSMVGTLVHLQELRISYCINIEVIVKEAEQEECDSKVTDEHAMFPCLKSLKLEYLSSLKGFCLGEENFTLPLLDTLVIKECPQIRIFTQGRSIASELKFIQTSFGLFRAGEDINSFIKTIRQEGNIFGELDS